MYVKIQIVITKGQGNEKTLKPSDRKEDTE